MRLPLSSRLGAPLSDLAPKEMAASDMRIRHHVQLLLTWSKNAAHPVSPSARRSGGPRRGLERRRQEWVPRGRRGRVRAVYEGTKAAPSTTKAPQASKIFKGSFQ
ncbi:hypothetical protein LAZ67_1001148 [Cordylochernes scorpioides]|uniref:Uncharacterized protein n=1 Tax=Cordylochernes scorpioides TaxID=51811 RepID=A0ABY6JXR8_9ARAC|nr:hypothetical protein LAZ67_1001148 [Cordylochernes scorpioides]